MLKRKVVAIQRGRELRQRLRVTADKHAAVSLHLAKQKDFCQERFMLLLNLAQTPNN